MAIAGGGSKMGEAKQIQAEQDGYGTYQLECTEDEPCPECLWADRQEAVMAMESNEDN